MPVSNSSQSATPDDILIAQFSKVVIRLNENASLPMSKSMRVATSQHQAGCLRFFSSTFLTRFRGTREISSANQHR